MARAYTLCHVKDWPAEARRARFHPEVVAANLGVTLRYLEQFFRLEFDQTPSQEFAPWRRALIKRLIGQGKTGEEIARETGFSGRQNLCRFLKEELGQTLNELREQLCKSSSH